MELTDNCFRLAEVRTEGEKAYVVIELLTKERDTAQCYWDNYYEGLYIGKGAQRYQVYAERTGEKLVGEIYYDSIVQNAVPKQDNILCLWVRLRAGNTVIDQMVRLGTGESDILFGHRDVFQLIPVSDYEFYFLDCRNRYRIPAANPIRESRDGRDIRDVRIWLSENALCFTAGLSGGLRRAMEEENNVLCLAWKDRKTKLLYYFHPQTVEDGQLSYRLEGEELDVMGQLETDGRIFDWIMTDASGREYVMYGAGERDKCGSGLGEETRAEEDGADEWLLPGRDLHAVLKKSGDGSLAVQVVTTVLFSYRGADETGNGIVLELPRRSYPLAVTKFLAQRVNTDLVYPLPFRAVEEEEKLCCFVALEFDTDGGAFRTGIYQFYVEVQDGAVSTLHSLKLYRKYPVRGNTYILSEHPYAVIDHQYYSCLFYNDTSNNFKCSLQPKRMKICINRLKLREPSECLLEFTMQKEPFFDWITSASLETENGELLREEFRVIQEDWRQVTGEIVIALQPLYARGRDLCFRPVLSFQGREGLVYLENNFIAPAVSGRETRRFSQIGQVGQRDYRRIWGDHRGKSYAVGISENLRLLTGTGFEIADGKLAARAEAADGEVDGYSCMKLGARNILTEETVWFQEAVRGEERWFELPVSKLEPAEYLLYGEFENGMISYLAMSAAPPLLYAYGDKRKLTVGKWGEAVKVSVEELLIYEDEERSRQCRSIIEKAQADRSRAEKGGLDEGRTEKSREKQGRAHRSADHSRGLGKIWLVGENYGLSARDNGLAFFEYCMRNRDRVDAEVYYVTKRENEDWGALEPYRERVLIYDSDDHIYYDELAEFYIVSHGIRDVMPSLYHDRVGIYRKPVIYLQHGIAAMKKFEISNKSYGGSIRRFIVSSEFERELMVRNRQFWEDEIAVTGIARHDKLSARGGQGGAYIWVMPTWRDWLAGPDSDFRNSLFYNYYSALLCSEELQRKLSEHGQKLVFCLHIEFEKYRHFFDRFENDLIHISDLHERKISDRVGECSMMVTDYSSIIFDAVYLGKPVVFFQFDQKEYQRQRGSYVDLETELPGEVSHTPAELTDTLIGCLQSGFVQRPHLKRRADRYFDFHDGCNAERIYRAVIECREEMAGEH